MQVQVSPWLRSVQVPVPCEITCDYGYHQGITRRSNQQSHVMILRDNFFFRGSIFCFILVHTQSHSYTLSWSNGYVTYGARGTNPLLPPKHKSEELPPRIPLLLRPCVPAPLRRHSKMARLQDLTPGHRLPRA